MRPDRRKSHDSALRAALAEHTLVELRQICRDLGGGMSLSDMRPLWEAEAKGYNMRLQYEQHLCAIVACITASPDAGTLNALSCSKKVKEAMRSFYKRIHPDRGSRAEEGL